jgi:hypothetical protein
VGSAWLGHELGRAGPRAGLGQWFGCVGPRTCLDWGIGWVGGAMGLPGLCHGLCLCGLGCAIAWVGHGCVELGNLPVLAG